MTKKTKKTKKTTIYYGKPKDRSYEAYVEFIEAMISKIAPNAKRTVSEEKKRQYWKEFWQKVDDKK